MFMVSQWVDKMKPETATVWQNFFFQKMTSLLFQGLWNTEDIIYWTNVSIGKIILSFRIAGFNFFSFVFSKINYFTNSILDYDPIKSLASHSMQEQKQMTAPWTQRPSTYSIFQTILHVIRPKYIFLLIQCTLHKVSEMQRLGNMTE